MAPSVWLVPGLGPDPPFREGGERDAAELDRLAGGGPGERKATSRMRSPSSTSRSTAASGVCSGTRWWLISRVRIPTARAWLRARMVWTTGGDTRPPNHRATALGWASK